MDHLANLLVARHDGHQHGAVEVPDAAPWNSSQHGPNVVVPDILADAIAVTYNDPWMQMGRHSNRISWLTLAVIGLAILPGLLHRLRIARPRLAARLTNSIPGYYALAAGLRRVGYVRPGRIAPGVTLPPLGATLTIAAFCSAVFIYCLSITPYYRTAREWGSPPLAIRAGMLANALIPFMFALATKVNVITLLTSLSHERLQIYHQWISRLALVLGLIHTIPFIWQPLHDAGPANLWAYWKADFTNTTGAVALAMMIWMVASSTRVFRNMSYRFFVINHIVTAIIFLGFYFKHTGDLLDTWKWLWAAVAVWGASTLLKWSRSAMASRYFVGAKASVEVSGDALACGEEVIRIAVRSPVRWAPGQHAFLRFPGISPLASNPWTIMNVPQRDTSADSQLVFVARVYDGITRSLMLHVAKHSQQDEEEKFGAQQGTDEDEASGALLATKAVLVPAIIDGPYGSSTAVVEAFDEVLLMAGGMGVTVMLPTLMHMASASNIVTKHVTLVWSVKTRGLVAWFQPYLDALKERFALSDITFVLEVHVTREGDVPTNEGSIVALQRPHAATRVSDAALEAAQRGAKTLAVVVCGPEGMANDVGNAAARLQTSRKGLKEVYLLNECFGW